MLQAACPDSPRIKRFSAFVTVLRDAAPRRVRRQCSLTWSASRVCSRASWAMTARDFRGLGRSRKIFSHRRLEAPWNGHHHQCSVVSTSGVAIPLRRRRQAGRHGGMPAWSCLPTVACRHAAPLGVGGWRGSRRAHRVAQSIRALAMAPACAARVPSPAARRAADLRPRCGVRFEARDERVHTDRSARVTVEP
jgi:hypothetical protein